MGPEQRDRPEPEVAPPPSQIPWPGPWVARRPPFLGMDPTLGMWTAGPQAALPMGSCCPGLPGPALCKDRGAGSLSWGEEGPGDSSPALRGPRGGPGCRASLLSSSPDITSTAPSAWLSIHPCLASGLRRKSRLKPGHMRP